LWERSPPTTATCCSTANFATTDEVRANINSLDITAQVLALLGIVPDLHIKVQDAAGRSIEALEAFERDRQEHPDRYVAASLPQLPFDEHSFDLVVCGHLLFSDTERVQLLP